CVTSTLSTSKLVTLVLLSGSLASISPETTPTAHSPSHNINTASICFKSLRWITAHLWQLPCYLVFISLLKWVHRPTLIM
ncbi:hypothetical protein FRC20_007242, partial [Serendipita sp. 405]